MAVTVLALLLRAWHVRDSLWLDELHTAWCASGRLADVEPRAAAGNHSPLFFYLAWASLRLLGDSEFALRFPSLVAGVALVPALGELVRRWTGSLAAGLLAAVLVAVDRNCVFYAGEARPYACVQLLGVVHVCLFSQLLVRARYRDRVGLILGAAALFYLHYTAALVVAAELCAYALLLARSHHPAPLAYRPASWIIDHALIFVCWLPRASHLWMVAGRRENWELFVARWPGAWLGKIAVVYIVVPLVVMAAAHAWRRNKRRSQPASLSRPVTVLVCWMIVPLAIAWLTTTSDVARLLLPRYLAVSLVAPMAFAGFCYLVCPGRVARTALVTATVAASLANGNMLLQLARTGKLLPDRNERWGAAVQWIDEAVDAQSWPVFLCADIVEDRALRENPSAALTEYCLFPLHGIYRLAPPDREVIPLPTARPLRLTDAERQLVKQRGGAWLIVRGDTQRANQMIASLLDELNLDEPTAADKSLKSFGDVQVVRITPRKRRNEPE